MGAYESALEEVARRAEQTPAEGYIEGGILHCKVCHEPKEAFVRWFGGVQRKVRITCKCQRDAEEELKRREQEERTQRRIKRLRKNGITDALYLKNTFAADKNPESTVSRVSRNYVEAWELMKQGGHGMLLYGPPGTGKSFYACCIANALIDRGTFAFITSVPRILEYRGGYENEGSMRSELASAELLVLDDLGAERDTAYALEKVYDVVDLRYRTGKPLIVTTNLTQEEMEGADIQRRRIYDRVLEMCDMRLKLDGTSHRAETALRKRQEAAKILSGGTK